MTRRTSIPGHVLPGGSRRERSKANSLTPEARVVAEVRRWAAAHPDVYLCRVVQAGTSGTPDFLLCINGHFVAIEAKAPGQRPRALQMVHLDRITAAGGTALWGDADAVLPQLDALYNRLTGGPTPTHNPTGGV